MRVANYDSFLNMGVGVVALALSQRIEDESPVLSFVVTTVGVVMMFWAVLGKPVLLNQGRGDTWSN